MSNRHVPESSSRRQPSAVTDDDARLAAAALRAGAAGANAAFDRLLPAALRDVADDYWTPTPVTQRVAAWLQAERVRTVVDIGAGAGKFCVATALLTPCRVIGLEQRGSLVAAAQALARRFGLGDRVSFVHGGFGEVPTPEGDAYYLFNPFIEHSFDAPGYADDGVTFTRRAGQRHFAALIRLLASAPAGTTVVTYNGIGGPLPRSYVQVRGDESFRGALRLWKKRPADPRRQPRSI